MGALATYNTWTYGYNTEQMLVSASKTGTSASFLYDPSLRQTQKTVGAVKTKYNYSGSHIMEEWNGAASPNTLTTRYVYAGADEPVLQMTSAGVVTYIHDDHHGSVIAQSNATTGAVGNRYKYGPFGESAAALTGTIFGYTGQRFDSELGLYHYKARYYHAGIGRFLQPDPIGYQAGMNLYAYCNNDGLNHTDPDGLDWKDHLERGIGLDKSNGPFGPKGFAGKYGPWIRKALDTVNGNGPKKRPNSTSIAPNNSGTSLTPHQAHREVKRQAGIPTSQQPVSQISPVDRSKYPPEHAGRQQTFEVPGPKGSRIKKSVQHSLSDRVPGHGPHWEAGPVKPGGELDPMGRPKLTNQKAKVNENEHE